MAFDPKYSFKDFSNQSFVNHQLGGLTIQGSCFSQPSPDAVVFASGLIATFVNCNLDNCAMPFGCTIVACSQKRLKLMNDDRVWEVDSKGVPLRLPDEDYWLDQGCSIDPMDIPVTPIASNELLPRTPKSLDPQSVQDLKALLDDPGTVLADIESKLEQIKEGK